MYKMCNKTEQKMSKSFTSWSGIGPARLREISEEATEQMSRDNCQSHTAWLLEIADRIAAETLSKFEEDMLILRKTNEQLSSSPEAQDKVTIIKMAETIRSLHEQKNAIEKAAQSALQAMLESISTGSDKENICMNLLKKTMELNASGESCETENEAEEWNYDWDNHMKIIKSICG